MGLRDRRQIFVRLSFFGLLAIAFWLLNRAGNDPSLDNESNHGAGPRCLQGPLITPPSNWNKKRIDWSKYAYVQYVTNSEYLCNSIMLFEQLHSMGSKAERLLLHPSHFSLEPTTVEGRLLRQAQDMYKVKIKPIEIQLNTETGSQWAESFTKLLAFNQTEYSRVLHLDSDSSILKPMDELFLLRPSALALPPAYWMPADGLALSSTTMVVTPSSQTFDTVLDAISRAEGEYWDMEIINDMFSSTCDMISHRKYQLLSGEFRRRKSEGHRKWLSERGDGLSEAVMSWDPEKTYQEASYVHFSDWPLPKPWNFISESQFEEMAPECVQDTNFREDCRAKSIWKGLYTDFKERRERVCEN